jgi:hypothetical protein
VPRRDPDQPIPNNGITLHDLIWLRLELDRIYRGRNLFWDHFVELGGQLGRSRIGHS